MMKKFLFFVFFLASFSLSFAQERTISGIVTSEFDGETIPGVSVVAKGTTVGMMSDVNGKYSIVVNPDTKVLIFSYIGMKTKEVEIGLKNTVNVALETEATGIDEVVVTAMGIKKAKKSLGYAVENVGHEELMEGNQTNIVNALQGKVAGVSITNSGGAPGASSVIMIRGGNSLSGDNQPLFVVDGIPIDNSTVAGELVANSNRGLDLNSEDIESVSILKGPAAAALYGIKAANGAVIITTKTGKAGEAKISYNGSFSVDNIVGVPDMQTIYGQGSMIRHNMSYITTFSWDTLSLADTVPIYNNLQDFYQTAYSSNHNLSYSGGNEKSTVYASLGRLDNNGVMDRTSYDRTSFRLNATSSLKKNLKIGSSFNYVNSASNRTRQGSSNSGSFRSILNYPVNVNMNDYLNEDGTQKIVESLGDAPMDNPYWSSINNPITNRVDRYIGIANVSYDPFKFLNITYRIGSDIFMEKNKSSYAWGSARDNYGSVNEYEAFNQITTSTLLLNANHKIAKHSFGLTAGTNTEDNYYRRTNWSGENFIEPDFVGINNIESADRTVNQKITRKRIVSAFGELKYDWNSEVFLNLTGRVDKTSTLPEGKKVFFYPSAGVSVLVSSILKNRGVFTLSDLGIDYFKIRSTWAQVGKDAPPHVLQTPMVSSTNSYTIDPEGFMRAIYPTGNPALLPEFTNSFEVGTDIRLFNNRVGIDFSYYNMTSLDQILFIRMAPSTSTFGGYLNAGSINNKGIELLLRTTAVKKTNFNWYVDLNFARAVSHVNELPGEIKQVENSDSWAFNSIAEGAGLLDGPVFGIYGKAYMRNDNGDLLLDQDGMVQFADVQQQLGDRYPNWTAGISNKLQYKNITLNFLVDISYGNDVLNGTKAAMVYYGLDPITENRGETVVFDGLRSTGTTDTNGNLIYEPNDSEVVLDQDYYQNIYSGIGENFVEDGSWVRLRYVTLTYDLPTKWFKDKISKLQFNVTGRNLFILTNYSGVDPEINTIGAAVMGTGSIGIDNLGTPSTKGIDFSIRLSF